MRRGDPSWRSRISRDRVGQSSTSALTKPWLPAWKPAGLKDLPHRPGAPEIGQEAREWMMSIACTQPKDLDLAAELWTITSLTRYIAQHGPEAGHPRLGRTESNRARILLTVIMRRGHDPSWRSTGNESRGTPSRPIIYKCIGFGRWGRRCGVQRMVPGGYS